MAQQPQTQDVRPTTTYTKGDMVLFRDVERFWLGKPGHTFVGRVERFEPGRSVVIRMSTGL